MTHICVSKLTIIGSDNGLSPGRRQAIIWTNAGILFIRTSSGKWRPFCLGLNELTLLLPWSIIGLTKCQLYPALVVYDEFYGRHVHQNDNTNNYQMTRKFYHPGYSCFSKYKNKRYETRLTDRGRDKIFQMVSSNIFHWIKIYQLRFRFHIIWFTRV